MVARHLQTERKGNRISEQSISSEIRDRRKAKELTPEEIEHIENNIRSMFNRIFIWPTRSRTGLPETHYRTGQCDSPPPSPGAVTLIRSAPLPHPFDATPQLTFFFNFFFFPDNQNDIARVVKLVDTHDSGSCGLTTVLVRIQSRAPVFVSY